jgi:hypothetical protein
VSRLATLVVAVVFAGLVAAGAQATTVALDRTRVSTQIGRDFDFTTTIRNDRDARASGLVAHLNVLSADPGTYVDPEDWSSDRTRYLRPLPAHGSMQIRWTVKAVNSGNIAIYVAVLPRHGSGEIVTSPPLRVEIAKRRTLNASGVLPLALGIPGLLGAAAIGTRARRHAARKCL